MSKFTRWCVSLTLIATVSVVPLGCGGKGGKGDGKGGGKGSSKTAYMSVGSAPTGGTFFTVGGAIADVLNKHSGENNWEFTNSSTKGSQANIRNLENGDLELALSNSAITYFAVRGESSWDKKFDMRAVVTLAPNVAMFIARKDSGITSLSQLKGKRVTIGPAGAGFEMFVSPILEAHGVSYDDFTLQNGAQSGAVENLGDGATDAAFLGGAIPTASIQTATNTFDVQFIPFDKSIRDQLVEQYPFFDPFTIPANTYKGQAEPFAGLNVGSMHLITSAKMDEEVIYQITKTIYENRAEIRGKHPAGKAINEKNAARYTGTEFHPGAIRFYKEIGIWKGGGDSSTPAKEKEGGKSEEKKAPEKKSTEKKSTDKKADSK